MKISFKMSWIVISNSRMSLGVFLDKLRLISAQKFSVGFRSELLAPCTDVMLCLPFMDDSNYVARSIVVMEEVIGPHGLADEAEETNESPIGYIRVTWTIQLATDHVREPRIALRRLNADNDTTTTQFTVS